MSSFATQQNIIPSSSTPNSPRPALLPSPFRHPNENPSPEPEAVQPSTASIYSPGGENSAGGQYAYPEADTGSLLPPPNFAPLFTLIRDTATGEYVHPSVYYIFSDDEADTMSTAALHALDSFAQDISTSGTDKADVADIEDRYVVVDLTGDATSIQEATSLSHKWAVTDAKLSPAPVFGGAGEDGAGSLMLVVEGQGIEQDIQISSEDKAHDQATMRVREARITSGGNLSDAMGEIFTTLNNGLEVLDKIIGVAQQQA